MDVRIFDAPRVVFVDVRIFLVQLALGESPAHGQVQPLRQRQASVNSYTQKAELLNDYNGSEYNT